MSPRCQVLPSLRSGHLPTREPPGGLAAPSFQGGLAAPSLPGGLAAPPLQGGLAAPSRVRDACGAGQREVTLPKRLAPEKPAAALSTPAHRDPRSSSLGERSLRLGRGRAELPTETRPPAGRARESQASTGPRALLPPRPRHRAGMAPQRSRPRGSAAPPSPIPTITPHSPNGPRNRAERCLREEQKLQSPQNLCVGRP